MIGVHPRWSSDVVQLAEPPGVVDLGPGHLDPDLLPTDLLRTAYAAAFDEYGPAGLTYGHNQGPLPLRAAIAERISAADGLACEPDRIVVTAGTSTTLDLLARWVRPARDVVVADELSYDLGLRIFRQRGMRVVRVPMDGDGMRPEELDRVLRAGASRVAAVYVLPAFHNPTGLVVPPERRLTLLEVASAHGVPVVEDDAYAETAFDSALPISIASTAGYRGVLRLGTFAKSLAPGLRLGWLATDPDTAARIAASAVFTSGGGVNHLAAVAVAGLLANGVFDAHVRRLRAGLRDRCDALTAALHAELPEVRFQRPRGGFFVWAGLPGHWSQRAAVEAAERAGVPVASGTRFGRGRGYVRLCHSFHGPQALADAVSVLARAWGSLG